MAELLSDTTLTEEQRLYANTIKNSGEALLVIINDVLDYSKIEADKLALHPEAFDLEACMHEVVMLLQANARDKGLTLLVDYDLFMPTNFIGDPGRIRQILTNLIGNAIKFTNEGHVTARVTGVPHPEDNTVMLHISIEDSGIGIPDDKIQHIFGEFNSIDACRIASAMGEYLPALSDLLGVDGDNNALSAKTRRCGIDKIGIFHRRRIDRHPIGPGEQERAEIVDRGDASPHGQRHETAFCDR